MRITTWAEHGAASEITVREILAASERVTLDLQCDSHPVDDARGAAPHDGSIRPVWQMLPRRIDDALGAVLRFDLLQQERAVRVRVALPVLG